MGFLLVFLSAQSRQVSRFKLLPLKATTTTSAREDIIDQLTGSECFLFYCQKVGQLFWKKPDFLARYDTRFISFAKISIPKQKTRIYQNQDPGMHDRPERMLKMNFGVHQFNRLIGRE
jgi:hypothetical protein